MPSRETLLAFIALALAVLPARADTIYLKNGNRMEGAVTRETPEDLELDIGYGTVTLRKSDIRRIRRAGAAERRAADGEMRRRGYDSGRLVPKGAEHLAALFDGVRRRRDRALEAKQEKAALEEQAEGLRSEIASLKEEYKETASEVQDADPDGDAESYNRLIGDMNKAGARLRADELKLADVPEKERAADAEIPRYLEAYRRLSEYLRGPGAAILGASGARGGGSGPDADYYAWMRGELRKMAADFSTERVPSRTRNGNLIVDAVLNGRVHARLMVDTGASMTVLYTGVVDRLGLSRGKALGVARSTVADGRMVESPIFRLESIAVGKSRVRDSMIAAVAAPAGDYDGLLGMSFLGNFVVQVDSAEGRLILRRLK